MKMNSALLRPAAFGLSFFIAMPLPVSFAQEKAARLPRNCQEVCVTPFGKELGSTPEGVTAYSNCQPACVFEQAHTEAGTYTGIEWQCVEYARRWLLKNKQSVFASVDFAYEIWSKIPSLKRVSDNADVLLTNWPNGSAREPRAGDLLIYSQEFAGTGHVAVITKVDRRNRELWVAEQNNRNEPWPGKYARKIPYVTRGKQFWLLDTYLIGWKSLAAPIAKQ